jgi:hypothetical protein
MRAVLHLVDTGLGLYGVLPPGSRGNHGEGPQAEMSIQTSVGSIKKRSDTTQEGGN